MPITIIKNGGHRARFLSYKRFQLKLGVYLAAHIFAMVRYCATKLTATCSSMIGQCFDTTSLASADIEWLY